MFSVCVCCGDGDVCVVMGDVCDGCVCDGVCGCVCVYDDDGC